MSIDDSIQELLRRKGVIKEDEIALKEGDLLIFPAYLPHSVGQNLSDEDRIIISFNIDILK